MCVSVSPGFTPPLANFDCDSAEVLAPAPSVAPAKKAKKGKAIRYVREAMVLQFHCHGTIVCIVNSLICELY